MLHGFNDVRSVRAHVQEHSGQWREEGSGGSGVWSDLELTIPGRRRVGRHPPSEPGARIAAAHHEGGKGRRDGPAFYGAAGEDSSREPPRADGYTSVHAAAEDGNTTAFRLLLEAAWTSVMLLPVMDAVSEATVLVNRIPCAGHGPAVTRIVLFAIVTLVGMMFGGYALTRMP